jgi:hypothetical protein
MRIEFHEQQKFTQPWLWLIVVGVASLALYGAYQQIVLGLPFGNQPMSTPALLVFCLSMLGAVALFGTMQLTTDIDDDVIRMTFVPFVKRHFSWSEIKRIEVVNYGFVGGWGIRPWTRYGTVYNVRGQHGLAVELLNGKKLLIGTQKADRLASVVQQKREQLDATPSD